MCRRWSRRTRSDERGPDARVGVLRLHRRERSRHLNDQLCLIFWRRRVAAGDTSCHNWVPAITALGEGWHNNHHHFSASTRQGLYWWEVDITYYALKVMSWMRLVRDLKPVPPQALTRSRIDGSPASA